MQYLCYLNSVAPVAQRIEQLPSKQLVTGSIPVWGTTFFTSKQNIFKLNLSKL